MTRLPTQPTIRGDLVRFRKHAAVIGAMLAIICHIVPPDYRAVCDALASICSLPGG